MGKTWDFTPPVTSIINQGIDKINPWFCIPKCEILPGICGCYVANLYIVYISLPANYI